MSWAKRQSGFTIVELLIVVVVIAILAAITIISYNGISNRAKTSAVLESVAQAVKKIELSKTASTTNSYAANATDAGIGTMSNVGYFYNENQTSYCVQAKNGDTVYSATNTKTSPALGSCAENGLIGWWKFNGDGSDSTTNARAATIATGVPAVGQNGQANGSYEFDGTVPAARVLGSEDILTPENTFSFWYNADTWNSSAATSFIAKRSGTTSGHFIMRLTSSNSLSIDCGGSNNRWTPGVVLPLGQWAHIAVVCTPSYVAAYVNGVSVGSATRTSSNLANGTILQFGQDGTSYGIDGRMDDIRLFDRALGLSEVQQLYSIGAQ